MPKILLRGKPMTYKKQYQMRFLFLSLLIASIAVFLEGCQSSANQQATKEGQKQDTALNTEKKSGEPQKVALKRVSDRPENKKGDILIAEYHRILPKESSYARSITSFRSDLQKLYELGFRPVTLIEFLEDRMNIPPGSTPVVLTFDDSTVSQFKILPGGKIDPDCAVGILKDFSEKHPDFPVKATFYILPDNPFGQAGFLNRKLALLKEWGCEIGSHTMTHRSLSKLSDDEIKKELGESVDNIRELGFEPKTMAVPYGCMPKDPNILKSFTWNNKQYGFKANVRSMARPARSPLARKPDDPVRTPRVIANDAPLGFTHWLEKAKNGEVDLYVQP